MKGIIINFEEGKAYRSLHNGRYYKYENKCFFEQNDYGKWESASTTVDFLTNTEFEEVKKEIDWNKVPKWTRVQVRDSDKEEWINTYFLDADGEIFHSTRCDEYTYDEFEDLGCWQCRIHPSVRIKEDWYKRV